MHAARLCAVSNDPNRISQVPVTHESKTCIMADAVSGTAAVQHVIG